VALRTLPAPESERLEEHFLICSECRDRLESTDEWANRGAVGGAVVIGSAVGPPDTTKRRCVRSAAKLERIVAVVEALITAARVKTQTTT